LFEEFRNTFYFFRFSKIPVRSQYISTIRQNECVVTVHCFSVDQLFKEANVGRDGHVHYEEFTRMVTLPSVDY